MLSALPDNMRGDALGWSAVRPTITQALLIYVMAHVVLSGRKAKFNMCAFCFEPLGWF